MPNSNGWGLIGLGVMGAAIAARLLQTVGPGLRVYDVRPDAAEDLERLGGQRGADPADVAARCDIVVLSLNSADVVRQVVTGDRGILSGAAPGLLVIDMSSIDPVSTRAIAERAADRGVRWVDAPLSGGAPGAAAGRLSLMVGGAAADVQEAQAILGHLATRVTHCGGTGAGQTVKLINQVMVGLGFAALAEASALIRAEGLNPATVLEAISGGRADSALAQEYLVKFATADPTPTGRVLNMVKDLETARSLAVARGVPLPLTTAASEQNRWLAARGLGSTDNTALMTLYDPDLDERWWLS